MEQEKIGKFIKKIRIDNGFTQREFADRLGVTYQAVSKWENGKNIPDIMMLKLISKEFNVNIDDLLEGRVSKKGFNFKVLFILLGVCFLLFLIFLIFFHSDDFSFKTLSSSCDDFNISGSISYNKEKSSIYISNIDYCGGNDVTKYKLITCDLYERYGNVVVKVKECDYDRNYNVTLEEFLKGVSFVASDYRNVCKDLDMYIEINAFLDNGKSTNYKIPLNLEDCK
jgi:transcriptional regulator with XRE-family HTH domain